MFHRLFDYALGSCCAAWGMWVDDHFMVIVGGALVAYRLLEALLELWGIQLFGIFRRNRDKSPS